MAHFGFSFSTIWTICVRCITFISRSISSGLTGTPHIAPISSTAKTSSFARSFRMGNPPVVAAKEARELNGRGAEGDDGAERDRLRVVGRDEDAAQRDGGRRGDDQRKHDHRRAHHHRHQDGADEQEDDRPSHHSGAILRAPPTRHQPVYRERSYPRMPEPFTRSPKRPALTAVTPGIEETVCHARHISRKRWMSSSTTSAWDARCGMTVWT